MEPHPVPQNILDVEFKLFGSFTLKEFSKILFGGLIALGVYFIPFLPIYIKLPIMAISVIIGVGLAIIPSLGTWLSGFTKSLFVSPRYVWKKEAKTPELLKEQARKKNEKNENVKGAKNKSKIELNEVSLQQILASRSSTDEVEAETPVAEVVDPFVDQTTQTSEMNLDKLYNDLYTHNQNKKLQVQNQATQIISQTQVQQAQQSPQSQAQPMVNTIQLPNREQGVSVQQSQPPETSLSQVISGTASDALVSQIEDMTPRSKKEKIEDEIIELKKQLQGIVKDQNYKEKESEILERINDLYHELRTLGMDVAEGEEKKPSTTEKGETIGPGQSVFGIVVDASDEPVSMAKISFNETETGESITTETSRDGRFATENILPRGIYEVLIEHPSIKFNKYRISIADQKLPAYKFRAR